MPERRDPGLDSFQKTAKAREEALAKQAKEMRERIASEANGEQGMVAPEAAEQAAEQADYGEVEVVSAGEVKDVQHAGGGEVFDMSGIDLGAPEEPQVVDQAELETTQAEGATKGEVTEVPLTGESFDTEDLAMPEAEDDDGVELSMEAPAEEAPAEEPQKAEIGMAYGGHQASGEMGKVAESTIEVAEIDPVAQESQLRDQAAEAMRAKIAEGGDLEDLMGMVEGQIEELGYDIDELEEDGGQDVILKEKYLDLSKLDAQRSVLLDAGADSTLDAPEVAAGTGEASEDLPMAAK